MHRRDLLRWAGYLVVVTAVGCRPSSEVRGTAAAGAAGRAFPPGGVTPPPDRAGPLLPRDGLDPQDFAAERRVDDEVGDEQPPGDDPSGEHSAEPPADEVDETSDPAEPDDEPDTDEGPSEPEDEPEDESGSGDDEEADAPSTRRVEVICRDALGLVPATSGGSAHTPRRLTLHHTQVELGSNRKAPGRLRSHQRYHQEQGWVDIAYHFGVDLEGNLYELRDPAIAGETFTEYDPAGHFLVVCEGHYDLEVPSDAMLQATAEILAYGVRTFGIPADSLTGHRDHAAGVTCPGEHLYARLGALRQETARLAGQTREHSELCGDAGRDRVAAIEAG